MIQDIGFRIHHDFQGFNSIDFTSCATRSASSNRVGLACRVSRRRSHRSARKHRPASKRSRCQNPSAHPYSGTSPLRQRALSLVMSVHVSYRFTGCKEEINRFYHRQSFHVKFRLMSILYAAILSCYQVGYPQACTEFLNQKRSFLPVN